MDDARTREIAPRQTLHALPSPAAASPLTAAAKLPQPVTSHFVCETAKATAVAGHGVVVQPALYDTPQPAARFAKRAVPAFPQGRFDRLQRGPNAFGHREPMDREPAVRSRPATLVCEAQEAERLRPARATSRASFDGVPTELDQTCFPLVQFQTELGEPRAECLHTRHRLIMVLETDHEVIRIADHDDGTTAVVLPPPYGSTGRKRSVETRSPAAVKSLLQQKCKTRSLLALLAKRGKLIR